MAVPFKSPKPKYSFNAKKEGAALDAHFRERGVPRSGRNRLLLASWNIANLGAQGRSKADLTLIARLMRRFDLIAVQEVNSDFRTFKAVVGLMGPGFDFVMTDTAGNTERLAFVYRKSRVKPLQLFGEVALRDGEFPVQTVEVEYVSRGKTKTKILPNVRFRPFDRNPFIGSFRSGKIDFILVNVHLYFGAAAREDPKKFARRVLEIYALSRWADRQVASRKTAYDRDMILVGDMNVPAMSEKNAAYRALIEFGFQPMAYLEEGKVGGSNIANSKTYDQVVFAPANAGARLRLGAKGVFDFDNAVFKDLWKRLERDHKKDEAVSIFNAHVKFHLSDHRPLWVELKT